MKKRELKFMTCCPDDTYFTWQVHLWLENLKQLNHSDKAVILIFIPVTRNRNPKWDKIIALYPEATFKFYRDDRDEISRPFIPKYISVLRPWLMTKWFEENPEYSKHAIFYCDSDILFTEKFDINAYVDDDINYLSDTNSYISVSYFDRKINDVLPEKKEEYEQLDVFAMLGSLIGITREQGEHYIEHSGGAQYLLKNVDATYWKKVMKDCMIIKGYLENINRNFFASEAKGFQSWCADMWAVLWNLWFNNADTKVIPEMAFSWSTDNISKLEQCPIMHNAGVTGKWMGEVPFFYKGSYHTGQDPTDDPHFEKVLNHDVSKTKCNWYYANELKKLKEKYNVKY